MSIAALFQENLQIANVGLRSFYDELLRQGEAEAVHVDWKPPANGNPELIRVLGALMDSPMVERTQAANREVLDIINRAQPVLIDVQRFGDIFPSCAPNTVLHAGPPLSWEKMCGPLRGAVVGALVFEGIASDQGEVERMAEAGEIDFRPNHDFDTVGPMTGITTPSMPVFVVRNTTFGNLAYCTINEGLGKVMRFGANDESVLERLRWLRDELGPSLQKVLRAGEGVNLKVILSKALAMGDEMHQRNIAASALFARDFFPELTRIIRDPEVVHRIVAFISGNEQWFLNLAMAAGKATTDPARNVEASTVVTAMARNGTNFGIRVSGLGDRWFEAPVEQPAGLYFPGFSESDANPDIGDSTIVESFGFGGMAMACAPAVTRFVGVEDVEFATRTTERMRGICVGASHDYLIPAMNFAGLPTGIDICAVVESGIRPVINTGIAHRDPGVGQIGAGVVHPPLACFEKALLAFEQQYSVTGDQGRDNRGRDNKGDVQ